jgi:hypothetical protein
MSIKSPIVLMCTFLWIGFVTGISFLEAPLKFQAPHITLALGLGIGRLVFAALNKVEWVFACAIAFSLFRQVGTFERKNLLLGVPFLILLVQTLWLLPALDARAEQHIQGAPVPDSYLHLYYVATEVVKISCLLTFGIKLFQSDLATQHFKKIVS